MHDITMSHVVVVDARNISCSSLSVYMYIHYIHIYICIYIYIVILCPLVVFMMELKSNLNILELSA